MALQINRQLRSDRCGQHGVKRCIAVGLPQNYNLLRRCAENNRLRNEQNAGSVNSRVAAALCN